MKKIFLVIALALMSCGAWAQKPERDTAWMEVQGRFASFEFDGTDSATYCVDWGDGIVEKIYNINGFTQNVLKHIYTDSGIYNVRFWGKRLCDGWDEVNVEDNYTETMANLNFTMDMIFVQGGTFTMGCTSEQGVDCNDYEKPAHPVTLSSYHISKYEITQAQWKAVMGTTIQQQRDKKGSSYSLYGVGANYPMYYVSWTEAKEFCEKLSQKTGKKYALPTEAQWEFAARGGVKSKGFKYSGSNDLGIVAWYGHSGSTTVGSKDPNELGIYDMSGNVWEWCADWYGAYSSDAVTNPKGPDADKYNSNRVARGGGWGYYGYECRVSSRNADVPGSYDKILGFRVVCLP